MDEELVVLAQQGDRHAFESLTLAHYTRLYRVAKSILRDRYMAEDATQEALLDIWRYIRRLREPSRFNGWSYRLLVHACYAEAKRVRARVGEVEPLPADVASTADAYGTVADRDQLERGFRRMNIMPELAARLEDVHAVVVHPASLSRFLRKAGFTYKKSSDRIGAATSGRRKKTP